VNEILFKLGLFRTPDDPRERAASERVLVALLNALLVADVEYLRLHPDAPSIYSGVVRYERELLPNEIAVKWPQCASPCKAPVHPETWQGIAECIRTGEADCEDLACWRCAERIVREHVAARPDFSFRKVSGLWVYHIFVRNPDGSIEDPSRKLGMV
jgi:hypothetical protein